MTDLLDRSVEVQAVLATSPERAGALDHPVRAAILDVAAREPRSVDEIVEELEARGFERAPTTVRHHVDVLREAGLLELARLDESGRGVTKYYGATVRFLHHDEPEGFDEALAEALEEAADGVADLVDRLRDEHGEAVAAVARSMRPCPHCDAGTFEDFVLARLLQRGTARALDPGDESGP